jgi:hypothetical protein
LYRTYIFVRGGDASKILEFFIWWLVVCDVLIYEKMGGWYPQKETNISSHSIWFFSDVENGGEARQQQSQDMTCRLNNAPVFYNNSLHCYLSQPTNCSIKLMFLLICVYCSMLSSLSASSNWSSIRASPQWRKTFPVGWLCLYF